MYYCISLGHEALPYQKGGIYVRVAMGEGPRSVQVISGKLRQVTYISIKHVAQHTTCGKNSLYYFYSIKIVKIIVAAVKPRRITRMW